MFVCKSNEQCLGFGSVGPARFWLLGYTDPDPRDKISTKNCKTKSFNSQNPVEKRDFRNLLNGSSIFSKQISKKKEEK